MLKLLADNNLSRNTGASRPWQRLALFTALILSFPLGHADMEPSFSEPGFVAPLISTDQINPNSIYFGDGAPALGNRWTPQEETREIHEGKSAMGRLLLKGLQTTYKSFRDSGHISRALPDERGQMYVRPDMKYNMKVKDDSVKIGLEYKF